MDLMLLVQIHQLPEELPSPPSKVIHALETKTCFDCFKVL